LAWRSALLLKLATVSLSDCSAPDASTIVASANVTSATGDPNPAPNNASTATVQVSNSAPVITESGPLNATVECATSYVDPGTTAVDACQGPVPVSTASALNNSQVGSYAVTYTAADQATPVVRAVNVTDTTPPVVSVIGANPMTIECAKPFVDLGATAADSCAGSLAVAETGTVNAGVPGSYLLGHAATDPSGNVGAASRAIGGLRFPLNRSGQFNVDGHTVTSRAERSPWTASRRSRAAAPSCCCRRTTTTIRSKWLTSSPA
jgi:hypothetical protein